VNEDLFHAWYGCPQRDEKNKCFGLGLQFNVGNIGSTNSLCQRDPVQALRDGSWKDIEQRMGSTEELQKVNESFVSK